LVAFALLGSKPTALANDEEILARLKRLDEKLDELKRNE
jgi:hypothetical protein